MEPFGDLEASQRELQAMEEVGRQRSQTLGLVFFVCWIGGVVVSFKFLGLIWGAGIGAAVAGAIAKSYVSSKTDEWIAAACKKYGVAPEALDRKKYIIE
jgi:hypothetical protein